MRIIAGSLGGRSFESPKGHKTHPMSDKVRGALFNKLGDIKGLSVLDAFSGTGALGFEAISRGAESALLIELERQAQITIEENIKTLDLSSKTKLVRANASSWSNTNSGALFDLVLLDPPYDKLQLQAVRKLALHTKPGGICILSWPGKSLAPTIDGLKEVDSSNYGDIQLVFFQKIG